MMYKFALSNGSGINKHFKLLYCQIAIKFLVINKKLLSILFLVYLNLKMI